MVLCLALSACAAVTQGQEKPPPSTGVGLLQLAINSSSYSMAEAAAAVAVEFPAAHVPDVARKLLLTAATRGHAAAVQILASCTTVQQYLDAGTVESVLQHFIEGDYCGEHSCYELVLCDLPVSQLDSAAVARLLQVALQHGRQNKKPDYVNSLLGLPAIEQVSVDTLKQLMLALVNPATTLYNWHTIEHLCILQAAQQLSSSVVEQLLLATIEWSKASGDNTCMEALCRLPAASRLSSDAVAWLLMAAVEHVGMDCMPWLCQLPGAQQLDSAALEPLVNAAVSRGLYSITVHLLGLPAAAQLSSSVVEQLLLATIQLSYYKCDYGRNPRHGSRDTCMEALCGLPAAGQLSSDGVARLLMAAVNCKPYFTRYMDWHDTSGGCIQQLCQLPGAQLDSTTLEPLLNVAVKQSRYTITAYLLGMPAAAQLSIDALVRLLDLALTCNSHECTGPTGTVTIHVLDD
jgi:hypothetical protein